MDCIALASFTYCGRAAGAIRKQGRRNFGAVNSLESLRLRFLGGAKKSSQEAKKSRQE
jgi:hypothetical protein